MNTNNYWHQYWNAVVSKNADAINGYFHPAARIRWHNTNEQFTAAEFVRINCEYPGQWDSETERVERNGQAVVIVTRIWSKDASFHVTSFITVADEKILTLDEYWGEDSAPPAWRQKMHIGTTIHGV